MSIERAGLDIRGRHHDGDHELAPLRIRHTEDRRLDDIGMFDEDVLDRRGTSG